VVQQTIAGYEEILLTNEVLPQTQTFATEVSEAETPVNSNTPVNWINIIGFIYTSGVLFILIRNVYSISRMLLFIKGAEKIKTDEATLLLTDQDIAPFSWMNYIIISRKDYNENREIVLTHELSHIRNKHSFDLLISEFFVLFQWYNPVAWLFRRELRDVHEFEADNNVLKSGIDAKTYQLLLIKKAVGSQHLTFMTNSFNHSKLEKRITMMLKENNNPYAKLKYLLLVPAFAIAVSVFARHEPATGTDRLSETESTEKNVLSQNPDEVEVKAQVVEQPEKNMNKQKVPGDPSDTINLKKYRVEAYIKGKKVDFNQWKSFPKKDGYIIITTDSATYYKGNMPITYTRGGTLHIPENTENLNGEKVQRKMIAAFAMKHDKQMDMVKAAGGRDAFLNSIDLNKFRIEAYRNGKRINFDEWENFRVEFQKKSSKWDPKKEGNYIVIDMDSAIYYKGDKRIERDVNPLQPNIYKDTENLSGEMIQRSMIASLLLKKEIDPNE